MWAIRILTGSQTGQVIPLRNGSAKIGRGTHCEVKLASASVSKEHAQVHVTDDKLIIADLNSRNGTFVNGVRVQRQILKPGDKVALHDAIFDVVSLPNVQALPLMQAAAGMQTRTHQPVAYPGGYEAPPYGGESHAESAGQAPPPGFSANSLPELGRAFVAYIDGVAMPGIYALAQKTAFRNVLWAYVGAFVVLVTLASTIPMTAVTKASIQAESQRRALTIARNLAAINRQAILEGLDVSISTQMSENEDGVESALLLAAKDGRVIAPLNRSAYADKPYVLRVRKKLRADQLNDREFVEQIDSSKIVASVPIKKFSAEGGKVVAAYAVIVYDMGKLAIDQGEALSLFVQNLAIALLLGAVLGFLLIKTVERPITALNAQLDDALREGKDDVFVEFQFPELAKLAANVNSALSRIGKSDHDSAGATSLNKDAEAEALIGAMSGAAIAVNAIDGLVIAANEGLYDLIGGGVDLRRKPLSDVHDQALQEHLRDLIAKLRQDPRAPAADHLSFSDVPYATRGVAVFGNSEPAFFLVLLNKLEGGG